MRSSKYAFSKYDSMNREYHSIHQSIMNEIYWKRITFESATLPDDGPENNKYSRPQRNGLHQIHNQIITRNTMCC